MLETLLYTTLTCQQTEAIMLKIKKHEDLLPIVRLELIETVKESNPDCPWDAND